MKKSLCKECEQTFLMRLMIYLSNGEFICQRCFGIDTWRTQQYRIPPLELGVIANPIEEKKKDAQEIV